jgi:spore coat protein JB
MINAENENRNLGCCCNNKETIYMNTDYNMITNNMENIMNNNNCDNMTRENMLNEIKCFQFAITELALYLDTHPEDERALCLHRKYARELKDLQDKYQKVYGPLTINFPCNKWRWIEEPWPWERGNY